MDDYETEAKRHRQLAEEYRAMADSTNHDGLRDSYRKLAETYDELAENELSVARNLKISH